MCSSPHRLRGTSHGSSAGISLRHTLGASMVGRTRRGSARLRRGSLPAASYPGAVRSLRRQPKDCVLSGCSCLVSARSPPVEAPCDLFLSLVSSTDSAGLDDIQALSWRQFESIVGEAFRRQGYSVAENAVDGADGGIDLALRKDGQKFVVQCKQWKQQTVGVRPVRELAGVMAGIRSGARIFRDVRTLH